MIRDIDSKFAVNLPYPPVKVNEENLHYANLILLNYAGLVSEFTAVSQYVYHEISVFKDYPVISTALKGISQVEMHHLQTLGELAVLLGGDPRYFILKKKTPHYWNPKFVAYSKTPKQLLLDDINGEKQAIAQYEKTISQIDDANIVAILKRIILDEEFHIKILNELYEKYVNK